MKASNNESNAEGPEIFITTYGVMINVPKGIVRIEAVIYTSVHFKLCLSKIKFIYKFINNH